MVDPSGELIAFARMEDTQFGSIPVAQRKAETAARFRTATIALEERLAAGRTALLGLPGIVPVAGGRPILSDGRVIGAIGVSGASLMEDDEVAQAVLGGPPL